MISRGNVYVDYGSEEAFYKAQKDYEHVLLKDARSIDAYINLAYLFQMTGRFMKAWNQFTQAININPSKTMKRIKPIWIKIIPKNRLSVFF